MHNTSFINIKSPLKGAIIAGNVKKIIILPYKSYDNSCILYFTKDTITTDIQIIRTEFNKDKSKLIEIDINIISIEEIKKNYHWTLIPLKY